MRLGDKMESKRFVKAATWPERSKITYTRVSSEGVLEGLLAVEINANTRTLNGASLMAPWVKSQLAMPASHVDVLVLTQPPEA